MKSDSSHGVLHFDVVVVVGLAVVVVVVAGVVVVVGFGGVWLSHLSSSKQGLTRQTLRNGGTQRALPVSTVSVGVEVALLVMVEEI